MKYTISIVSVVLILMSVPAQSNSVQDEILILQNVAWQTFRSVKRESIRQYSELSKAIKTREEFILEAGDRYTIVNRKDHMLRVVNKGKEVFAFKAVIGRKEQPTPLLKSYINTIVINPDWVVSPRTAIQRLAPKFALDPEFATVMGYEIYNGWNNNARKINPTKVKWERYTDRGAMPFKIRQVPGENNELGKIKFIVPNTGGYFVHGSPHKKLFNEEIREYSSGCIRIREVVEFADFLMEHYLNDIQINTLIKNKQTKAFTVPSKMPIYVVDWDVVLDSNGTVSFIN